MRLHDLLDRVASTDQPASRLNAEDLFAGGMRHRRRTRITRGVGAFGAAALAVAVVVVVSTMGGAPKTGSEPPADRPTGTFMVHAAGGHDRNHLWVWGEPAPGDGYLVASTADGGRTWTRHNEPNPSDRHIIVRNIGLSTTIDGPSGVSAYRDRGAGPGVFRYTTDSWRTDDEVSLSPTTIAGAPAQALVLCEQMEPGPCPVTVLDAAGGTYARLANQPPVTANLATRAPDGTIWAAGLDPATKRPAVASSADGGATWSNHVFTDLAPHVYEYARVNGAFGFGRNGAAVLSMLRADTGVVQVVRFSDGRWQRLPDIISRVDIPMWLAADGTHVLQDVQGVEPSPTPATGGSLGPGGGGSPPPTFHRVVGLRVCPPGGTAYSSIVPPAGFPTEPAMTGPIKVLPDGYLGYNYGGIWSSADGLTWQRVPTPT